MAEGLKKLGLKSDDTILMHSSLKSLGHRDTARRAVRQNTSHAVVIVCDSQTGNAGALISRNARLCRHDK